MSAAIHAPIKWAQRKDSLYLTIAVSDLADTDIKLTENKLEFTCVQWRGAVGVAQPAPANPAQRRSVSAAQGAAPRLPLQRRVQGEWRGQEV